MVVIGRSVYSVSNKMRGGSKVRQSSKVISPNTTNLYVKEPNEGNFTLDKIRIHDNSEVTTEENDMISSRNLSLKGR